MLARRRHRRQEKNKQRSIKAAARDIVEQELAAWRERLQEAKKESDTKRMHYRYQEEELRRLYDKSCQQLDQRRATLLATTSLIPYTQTIQAASNFRVPAPLLTLQARLCLHVHCLCVHEELLLKTKEQGWDTIAWMEDVSRQLRLLTQKQILLLQVKMQEKVKLIKQMDPEAEIPENIQNTLQQKIMPDRETKEATAVNENDTSTSAEGPNSSNTELEEQQTHRSPEPSRSKEESFLEFLQRYEQRKTHQQRADQMRLAEFRSRGNSAHVPSAGRGTGAKDENPYTSRRAGVGKKLKNYASKVFQGNGSNSGGGGMDDESLRLDDIESSHLSTTPPSNNNNTPSTINEESVNSLAGGGTATTGQRHSWRPFGRQRSAPALTQSESNLDTGWSLGSSLRGLRKRGLRKPMGIDMETQAEVGENSSSNDEEGANSGQDAQSLNKDEVIGGGDDNDAKSSIHEEADTVDVPTNGDNDDGESNGRTQAAASSASLLKEKMKAPVIHKFSESARW